MTTISLVPTASPAGDLQSWTELDYTALDVGRFEWSVSGGMRVRDGLGQIYDRRIGTIFGVEIGKGITVSGGYMLRNRDFDDFGYRWDHRLSAGLSYHLVKRGSTSLGALTLYERHVGRPDKPDFNRYRQRFELGSSRGGFSPWLYQDFTFLRQGFVRSRSRAGIRWRGWSHYTFSVGYQFESIREPGDPPWRPQHSIVTLVEIDKPIWKSER